MASLKHPFTPQTLRAVLLVLLIIVMSGGAGLFYIGLNTVRDFAVEVNQSVADAKASDQQIQSLRTLKTQLFATPATYQSQATADIRNYAAMAGFTVTGITFETVSTNPVASVSLQSPVSYAKLIQFLNNIENNLPKMQVSAISISHAKGIDGDSVTVDSMKIMIATRQ